MQPERNDKKGCFHSDMICVFFGGEDCDDTRFRTTLHYAAAMSSVKVLQDLIEKGADVNERCNLCRYNGGGTPLHFAAKYSPSVEVLKCLVKRGVNVDAKDNNENTPLHLATLYNSNIKIVQYLIEQGADVNVKNKDKYTPIRCAAKFALNVDVLKCLIEKGADVKNNIEQYPLLYFAVENPNVDVIKYLIENVADANAPYRYEEPLLCRAARTSNVDVVKYLITKGADVNEKTNSGKTALDFARTDEIQNILREAGGKSGKN